MTSINPFSFIAFIVCFLGNGSTAGTITTQGSCALNIAAKNPNQSCLSWNFNCYCGSDIFISYSNCGYYYRYFGTCPPTSRDPCSLQTDCREPYEWPHPQSLLLQNCSMRQMCDLTAPFKVESGEQTKVYNCSVSYQCGSATELIPHTKIMTSTKSLTTKAAFLTSGQTSTLSPGNSTTLNTKKSMASSDNTKVVSASSRVPVAAIVVPVSLVTLAIGIGVPLLLFKRRRYVKNNSIIRTTIVNTERESNQYETLSAAPALQNNLECHDIIKVDKSQSNSCATRGQHNICNQINTDSKMQQDSYRSKGVLASCCEYNLTGNLLEIERSCSHFSTHDVSCRKVVAENKPDIGHEHVITEKFQNESHPYFILEPQAHEYLQISTKYDESSATPETEENEYNRLQFSKPFAIADDNNDVTWHNSTEFAEEDYSHLGEHAVTVKKEVDYSNIQLVKQERPDEKQDYCNLYVKR